MRIKIYFIAFVLLVVVLGCATTTSVWHKTQELNTIQAYQEFLRKYPQSEFTEDANRRIENLAWEDALQANTGPAYLTFLDMCPSSDHLPEVITFFEKNAVQQDNYFISEFKDLMGKNPVMSKVRVRISSVPGHVGRYYIKGNLEWTVDPTTGQMKSMTWNPGSKHTLVGAVNINGYKFLSDPQDPLVFQMILQKGYVYQAGNGIVVTPKWEVLKPDR